MADVFISYSAHDRAIAERIEHKLRARHVTVWRDQSRLAPGDQWPKLLGEEISSSTLMLLLWSKHAKNSHYVDFEWGNALAQKKLILPFCLDGTDPPPSLSGLHHAPYQSEEVTAAAVAAALGLNSPPPAARKRTSPGVLIAVAIVAALLAASLLFLRQPAPLPPAPYKTIQLVLNAGALGAHMQIDRQPSTELITSTIHEVPLTLGNHIITIFRDKEHSCQRPVPVNSQTAKVPLDCF